MHLIESSDLTRSFPVNGKFTEAQRDVYEIVLAAMEACFSIIRPGTNWEHVHRLAGKRARARGGGISDSVIFLIF